MINNRGFTLIEIMLVVIIIGALAAMVGAPSGRAVRTGACGCGPSGCRN